jgi:hypothetical protein
MNPLPKWLYRYRPMSQVDRKIKMIEKHHIWLSDPTQFDDPWGNDYGQAKNS